VVVQEIAMQYYATFMMFIMAGVLVQVYAGKQVLAFAVIGGLGSIALANAIAYVSLRKRYAEIFFMDDHFALISVYEVLFKDEKSLAFPTKYASPSRSEDQIHFHFHDQIIVLYREDWEDFDLIWQYFTAHY